MEQGGTIRAMAEPNVTSDAKVAMETLEIAHHGFRVEDGSNWQQTKRDL